VVRGKLIAVYITKATNPGDVEGHPLTACWSVYRDTLTFTKCGSGPTPTGWLVKPWTRAG
jgi:hypothetical protein